MLRLPSFLVLLIALGACQTAELPPAPSRVVLVRHAEKADDGTRDPALTEAGRRRAEGLAADLEAVAAVFATEYRRTQETAAPTAEAFGLDVTVVPVGTEGLEAFVDRLAGRVRAALEAAPPGSTVLVVGHSNTTPAVAEALGAGPVPPISEDEYDRVITVEVAP